MRLIPHNAALLLLLASVVLAACQTQPASAGTSSADSSREVPMAKREPADATSSMQVFRAFGTEPFWGVNVEGDRLNFTTPENPAGQVMHGTRRVAGDGIEVSGTHQGKPFVLTVAPGDCSDGMSDSRYAWVSSFRYGDAHFTGCAEAAK